MKQKHRILAIMLAAILVLTSGCTKPAGNPETSPATAPSDTVPTAASEDASLNSLRQAMVETPQLFAVAYFGYHATVDSDLPVDPFAVMREVAPRLCGDLPFLLEISEDRIIGHRGDLFCIVPLDAEAAVAVSKGTWNESSEQYLYENTLYYSDSGEPILLFCNSAGFEPDTQLCIYGPSGDVVWNPRCDDNLCAMPLRNDNRDNLFLDFSPYREILVKEYADMKDEWVMPTAQMLEGTVWTWSGWLKDGREVSYRLAFHGNTLSVRWNDGVDAQNHEYTDAPWELNREEGYAVLSVDFREFAGVLRYNLMYNEVYERLYIGMDALQEELPIGGEPLYRFLAPPKIPEPAEMLGRWELAWSEVEGDRNEAEPGEQILVITEDDAGVFRLDCTNNAFPAKSYYGKELVVSSGEIYAGCGNDQWSATVDYTDAYGTEFTLTVLDDGMLMLRNYWEMDGAPMVSYAWFRRVD